MASVPAVMASLLPPGLSHLEALDVLAQSAGLGGEAAGHGVQPSGALLVALRAPPHRLQELRRRSARRALLLERLVDPLHRLAHPLHRLPDPTRPPRLLLRRPPPPP